MFQDKEWNWSVHVKMSFHSIQDKNKTFFKWQNISTSLKKIHWNLWKFEMYKCTTNLLFHNTYDFGQNIVGTVLNYRLWSVLIKLEHHKNENIYIEREGGNEIGNEFYIKLNINHNILRNLSIQIYLQLWFKITYFKIYFRIYFFTITFVLKIVIALWKR